jgi:hypothetical protein
MKILRKIINKALRDRARTEDIRKTCKVDNVVKAVRGKKMQQPYRKNDRQQSGKNCKRQVT